MAGPCPPLGRAPELCQLCGWALWLGSVAGPCPPLGRAPELCQLKLCGWAPWLGLVLLLAAPLNSVNSVAGLCGWALWLGLVRLLAAPLNSVNSAAGLLRGWALSSSCPPLGRAPELCQLKLWLGSVAGPCPPLGRAPELCQLCGWALWLGLVLLLSSSWPRP